MRRCLILVFATLVVGTQAYGQVGVINQEVPDVPQISTYLVNDAVFTSATEVDSYTMYFTNTGASGWGSISTANARFNVFADDGALDTEDPLLGSSLQATFVSQNIGGENLIAVSVSNLNLTLGPGRHWFGLTPIIDFATGQEFSASVANSDDGGNVVGSQTFAINPGGGFGLSTDWQLASELTQSNPDGFDFAFTLRDADGVVVWDQQPNQAVPEPATAGVLVLACVGLISRRRR